jgi:hypothetical protein
MSGNATCTQCPGGVLRFDADTAIYLVQTWSCERCGALHYDSDLNPRPYTVDGVVYVRRGADNVVAHPVPDLGKVLLPLAQRHGDTEDRDIVSAAASGLVMSDSERATLRISLTRFQAELEKPKERLLGNGANADALRLQHQRNLRALLNRLLLVRVTDER